MNRSLSQSQRLLHLRGRPKILLTTNFETAQSFIKKYKNNMIGVISDVRFPKKGIKDPEAGLKFAQWVRKIDPSIPIMLQSTEIDNREMAKQVNAAFLHKRSNTLLTDLRILALVTLFLKLPIKKKLDVPNRSMNSLTELEKSRLNRYCTMQKVITFPIGSLQEQNLNSLQDCVPFMPTNLIQVNY